jgi:hypothetical protein
MSEVREQGDIFFLYRARVGVVEVRGVTDVQRFFVVVAPHGRRRYRRLVVGRKRLPEPRAHEREWAFVVEVGDDPDQLRGEVEDEPRARPAGDGRYAIVEHGGHTHLAYALELPREPGAIQRELNILRQASYIVAVRNPDAPAPPGAGLPEHRRAEYPPELRERFGGRRFIPLDPPELLDHPGAELVLIGAAEDASGELGLQLDPDAVPRERTAIFEALRAGAVDVSGRGR